MTESSTQHLIKLAEESHEDPKFHRYMIDAQERREVGHYGDEQEEVTIEQATESFQWAEEFIQAVKNYLQTQALK